MRTVQAVEQREFNGLVAEVLAGDWLQPADVQAHTRKVDREPGHYQGGSGHSDSRPRQLEHEHRQVDGDVGLQVPEEE